METRDKDARWYALHVRSRFEKTVARHLQGKGYEEFLPLYSLRRQRSDRTKTIELPLFPGYVFCKFDIGHRLPVLMIPGVNSVVGIGKSPMAVDERELDDIRLVLTSGSRCEPWPYLRIGQQVRVEHGALEGTQGTVESFKNGYRLVISVHLLQRSVAVEIDADCLAPISPRSPIASASSIR
jgi:transcription antitermination factor NusG